MTRNPRISIIALAVACIACGNEPTAPITGATLHLSASQAAAVTTRLAQLAPVHPELSWLADSIDVAISAGVEVDSVGLVTTLGAGPFYAVALQRAITTSSNASATFDVILFDNPSNPTNFIIVDGWKQTPQTAPPTSVSGTFGGVVTSSSVTAHFFHVAGNTVTAWRAMGGTASFTGSADKGVCPSFIATSTVTCSTTDLTAAFSIDVAVGDNGNTGGTRTASLESSTVPGVLLRFHF